MQRGVCACRISNASDQADSSNPIPTFCLYENLLLHHVILIRFGSSEIVSWLKSHRISIMKRSRKKYVLATQD